MVDEQKVKEVVNVIQTGGVVLMQVDTVFGLVCNGLDKNAINRIESIKRRTKPSYGFFIRDINIAKMYAKFSSLQEECFKTVFPGYFTLILPASELSIKVLQEKTLGIANGQKTIGLRVPDNEFCLRILDFFTIPLLATSANISGQKTATKFDDIDYDIINSVDIVYHNNNDIVGLSSTVIDLTDPKKSKVIRNGSGNLSMLDKLISFEEK